MFDAQSPHGESPELINPVMRRMKEDELAIGMVIRLSRSGDVARIAKSSGHDFLFIDTQHAIFSLETIGHIAQVALGCGVATLVRARSCRDPDVALLLDCGATGIVFPDVNTADDARLAVQTCKFAPIGRRSLLTGYAVFNYKPVPPAQATRILNAHTLVIGMIETVQGLTNIGEIAAIDGVDVLLIGLTDMLADMGRPGAVGDPEIMQAVQRIAAAAQAHGKFCGIGGDSDPTRQAAYIGYGIRFFSLQSDGALLMEGATVAAQCLRRLAGSGGGCSANCGSGASFGVSDNAATT